MFKENITRITTIFDTSSLVILPILGINPIITPYSEFKQTFTFPPQPGTVFIDGLNDLFYLNVNTILTTDGQSRVLTYTSNCFTLYVNHTIQLFFPQEKL